MLWFLSLVVTSTVAYASALPPLDASVIHPGASVSAHQLLHGHARRIRSTEARLDKLMKEGVRRSRTFADLVTRVHRTDLIIYVETSHALGPDTVGRILLQTVAGGQRYLRVQVRSMLQGDQIIAVIAHELRHALEVAEDASVIDEATLTRLYRRIGHAREGRHAYDTDAARTTGLRVREELIG